MSPGGSGYFTCKQNMKLITTKFKSGGLHENNVVATWNLGNHLSICFWAQGNQEKPVSRWPVAGLSECAHRQENLLYLCDTGIFHSVWVAVWSADLTMGT